ncbi:MAG: TIGR03086 family metal-binding protein [Ilumatobacteraceae bacterium]
MTTSTAGPRHGSATVSLPSATQILITRCFDAPATLVFAAMTRPEHVRRWWGFETSPLILCEIDLRVGGSWRYVTRDDAGIELGWHGEYREIELGRRIVSTEVFEGFPDAESVNTMTLIEADGVTTMTTLVQHSSPEHRDGHINSGMEGGMQHTFNRLDGLLVALDEVPERYRRVAAGFTEVIRGVPADGWERPAPCEGWVARDVVRHLVDWVPALLQTGAAVDVGELPSVDESPAAAWAALDAVLQSLLDDPSTADRQFSHPQAGTHALDGAIAMFVLGDVLVHTWDLASATGQTVVLEADEVHRMRVGIEPITELLSQSGHYSAPVAVPADADEQTRLIALTGRRP